MFDRKRKDPGLIFIVEDNSIYAKTLEIFLRNKFPGAKIKVFPVGEVCLDNMHHNPDVIIMDYQLNTKYFDAADGLEMIKKIKAVNADVNIIVLSAQENINVTVDVMKETQNHYVPKDEKSFDKVEVIIREGTKK
ncbi:MAG: response regulator [Bacteroidota bacterium]|nr:response regulator [Bacteroidota bacterium]